MWETIILFGHTLFSLFLLRQMGVHGAGSALLSPGMRRILIILSFLLMFGLIQIRFEWLIFKILLIYAPVGLLMGAQSWLVSVWREQFLVQFEIFINNLIAQIKIGFAFRPAFGAAVKHLTQPRFQNYFNEILEFILFAKKCRPEFLFPPLGPMIRELKKADEAEQCLEHLENLRHYLRIRSIFRRKVRSALFQVRAQAYVLSVLYMGLLVFVLNRYGFQYPKLLLASISSFVIGMMILMRLGRKIKWTI